MMARIDWFQIIACQEMIWNRHLSKVSTYIKIDLHKEMKVYKKKLIQSCHGKTCNYHF